jgi:hypothetical protein
MPRQILDVNNMANIDYTIYRPTVAWLNTRPQQKIELCRCPVCGRTGHPVESGIDHKLTLQTHLGRSSYIIADHCKLPKKETNP